MAQRCEKVYLMQTGLLGLPSTHVASLMGDPGELHHARTPV